MKKILFSFITILAAFNLRANVITVSNNLAHPTQYTTVQSAIDAAAAGDSIYVLGSVTHYAAFSIDKALTIFGPGFLPQKANQLTAIIDGTISFTQDGNNSIIAGFVINGYISVNLYGTGSNDSLKNVTIERNELYNGATMQFANGVYQDIKIINNIELGGYTFLSGSSCVFNNFLIENNVCYTGNNSVFSNVTSNTVIMKNNVFIGNKTSSTGTQAFYSINNISLTNNIFVGYNFSSGINYATFDHNLAYLPGGTYASDPFATQQNASFTNIYNDDPMFVSVDFSNPTSSSNYNLQSGSPALTAASDGGQQGVYGGDPGASWAFALQPALPYIYSFTLNTATINAGGSINATVISKTHN